MKEEIVKNWITVPRKDTDRALKWAKQFPEYITNAYSVIGGRTEHYERGNDDEHFDFFWIVSEPMNEFERLFGVKV